MKLYDVAKLVSCGTKIRIFDWKDHSKEIYENCTKIPTEKRNRIVCMIDIFDGMIEITCK